MVESKSLSGKRYSKTRYGMATQVSWRFSLSFDFFLLRYASLVYFNFTGSSGSKVHSATWGLESNEVLIKYIIAEYS